MLTSHVFWAVVGMLGYSATTVLVKLAARSGVPTGVVVAIATSLVTAASWLVIVARGQVLVLGRALSTTGGAWSLAAGVSLAIAVTSLFRALELGPASVVVPIYGMFIVGAFVLGVLVLGEVATPTKLAGVAFAVLGAFLICR
jgi:transporter family protein